MGVPLYRWMVDFMENPNQKWKMTGGSPMFHQFSPKIIHHFPSSFLSKLMIAWKPSFSPKKGIKNRWVLSHILRASRLDRKEADHGYSQSGDFNNLQRRMHKNISNSSSIAWLSTIKPLAESLLFGSARHTFFGQKGCTPEPQFFSETAPRGIHRSLCENRLWEMTNMTNHQILGQTP